MISVEEAQKSFYHFKLFWTLTYFSFCGSISTFAFLVEIPLGIANSVVGLKIYGVIALIKKYNSKIKKKKKSMIKQHY